MNNLPNESKINDFGFLSMQLKRLGNVLAPSADTKRKQCYPSKMMTYFFLQKQNVYRILNYKANDEYKCLSRTFLFQ